MAKNKIKQKRLSYSEKVPLLYGDGAWTIRGVRRAKLSPIRVSDGPSGLRKVEDDSLSTSKCATSVAYPCPALMACSFDTDLLETYGKAIAKECHANGVDAILGPGINIKRNPLCGRNFEYYSEDPYVSGKLGASFIKGVQSFGVAACVKHFACNSQESYRMVNDSIVDERALREIYLRAFEISIKDSNPWMVMASYNKVNGTYACESKYLLLDILKGEWKYDGVVVSDWGGVNDMLLSHENGLDVEMPCYSDRFSRIINYARLRRGYLKRIDDIANRVSALSQRTHNPDIHVPSFSLESGHNLAVKIAEQSSVLVKNDGILPFKSLKNVAIIGELAEHPRLGGGGSSQVKGYKVSSFIQEAMNREGKAIRGYAPGYRLSQSQQGDENDLQVDALDLASRSDSVILFLGTSPAQESEGFDRPDLRLPDNQIDLFNRLLSVNQRIVVVLCTGAPVESGFIESASACLLTYFPGEGGGEAIYNLLLGKANPSGHLAETWPFRNYEVPSFGFYPGSQVQSLYRESIYVGYRYYLSANEKVRFPFGYGLSYTRFRFSRLSVSAKKFGPKDKLRVSLTVYNETSVPGDASVQIYVEPQNGVVFKAKRTLQGFKKVHLEGNAKEEVEIFLDRRAFEHYDTESHSFLIEGGTYLIEAGESCQDIVSSVAVEVEGEAKFVSHINDYPIYYQPPKDGFWQYDDAFEHLVGKVLPIPRDPRTPPYNLNSTIENIQSTFIGKKIVERIEERFAADENREMMIRSAMELPIRNVILAGVKERYAQIIVDLANGQIFSAMLHFFIHKKRNPR
ncbi:MAG: beta-glucosidase [Erysipelotrichaceae bacterium]|nr:beta-glucosidase [Erysipelotrichaceae bacterium]